MYEALPVVFSYFKWPAKFDAVHVDILAKFSKIS